MFQPYFMRLFRLWVDVVDVSSPILLYIILFISHFLNNTNYKNYIIKNL